MRLTSQTCSGQFSDLTDSRRASITSGNFKSTVWACLRLPVSKRLRKGLYDIRSIFLHEGVNFQVWVDPLGGMINEVQVGGIQVGGWPDEKSKIGKLLSQIPTFLGLDA